MEGDRFQIVVNLVCGISIHSLRMEGDRLSLMMHSILWHFNPLPPHGGRHAINGFFMDNMVFQSTPSAWRETFNPIAPA